MATYTYVLEEEVMCKSVWRLQARSHKREKRLLASSCPSVRPFVRCFQGGSHRVISFTFDKGDFHKKVSKNPDLVKI